ncbi:MAG TPA: helix-turn-helix transcriptional regulator [Longimicrobium sp.]|jgi:DNA-binding XRE family transcriptional regulator
MFDRETSGTDAVFERLQRENPEIAEAEKTAGSKLLVASNVLRLRVQRGMTQKQLAEALGVKQPRIAQIEGAEANLGLETLDALARVFGVDTAALFATDEARQAHATLPPTSSRVTAHA